MLIQNSRKVIRKLLIYFTQIFKELRKKGKPIPTNDIWICAIARQYDLQVFSFDAHFNYIDEITVIDSVANLKN